jgi:hypothetical protein
LFKPLADYLLDQSSGEQKLEWVGGELVSADSGGKFVPQGLLALELSRGDRVAVPVEAGNSPDPMDLVEQEPDIRGGGEDSAQGHPEGSGLDTAGFAVRLTAARQVLDRLASIDAIDALWQWAVVTADLTNTHHDDDVIAVVAAGFWELGVVGGLWAADLSAVELGSSPEGLDKLVLTRDDAQRFLQVDDDEWAGLVAERVVQFQDENPDRVFFKPLAKWVYAEELVGGKLVQDGEGGFVPGPLPLTSPGVGEHEVTTQQSPRPSTQDETMTDPASAQWESSDEEMDRVSDGPDWYPDRTVPSEPSPPTDPDENTQDDPVQGTPHTDDPNSDVEMPAAEPQDSRPHTQGLVKVVG